jgi:hypothetical protein
MNLIPVRSTLVSFLVIAIIILTSGCVIGNNQQPDKQNTIINPASATSIQGSEKILSIDKAAEIIRIFELPRKIENIKYVKTLNNMNMIFYEFQSDSVSFVVNPATGRVRSANWNKSGPVISGITGNISQSCQLAGTFAKEKYPQLWISNDTRDMDAISAKKWPLSIDTKYECTWFEILYYPDKKTSPHYTVVSRNSVDMVIDPSTGMIQLYEETYAPLNPALNLEPSISEGRAGDLAKQYFEKIELLTNLPSDETNNGLSISNDINGIQYLVWSFQVIQYRNNVTYGGLAGIDAHDGHVVWHASIA